MSIFVPIADREKGGEGVEKLKDLLQRFGHLHEEGRAPVSLPDSLPHTIEQAFGTIPEDMALLLSLHASVGQIAFGPPDRMIELRENMKETLEEHLKEYSELPASDERDIRDYKPFEKGIPLGTDTTGDTFFLATNAVSDAGKMPVIRFHHDQGLTATIAASSLAEYLCFELLREPAKREGIENQYVRLIQRKRSARIE